MFAAIQAGTVARGRHFKPTLTVLMTAAACVLVTVAVVTVTEHHSARRAIEAGVVVCVVAPLGVWLFAEQRLEVSIAVVGLYLGMLDGVVKLTSGSTFGTLGRDFLLYAVVLGAVARLVLRRTPIRLPPLSVVVILWLIVCGVQVANPSAVSLLHSVTSLRQDLEFVPLFFFGAVLMRSESRIRSFLILLVLVGTANGVVNVIQNSLSPAQLGRWGPGYQLLENGGVGLAARVFYIANGQAAVRPPGLGGTDGFGGEVCVFAIPALLALATTRDLRNRWLLAPAGAFIIAGIVTSQTRLDIVSAAIAIFGFGLMTATSRRGVTTLVVIAIVAGAGYGAISEFSGASKNRYSSLAPSKFASTVVSNRLTTFQVIPKYLSSIPFGAGLGLVGPARDEFVPAGAALVGYNGESEFTFLTVETGIPGLVVGLLLMGTFIGSGIRLRRIADPDLHRALTALTATLIVLGATWFFTPATSDSPGAPFLWFAGGAIGYWTGEVRSGTVSLSRSQLGRLARV